MKKSLLLLLILILYSSNSYSTPFQPTVMTITGQDKLLYDFKGGELTIPFTLTGTPAAVWLVINTKDKADEIVDVRNGYLGWHYVNKIDTTIYISQRFQRNPGETTITWDGRDENGNFAEAGEYSYYLWGYDDKSSRQQVTRYVHLVEGEQGAMVQMIEKDNSGMPLATPFLFGSPFDYDCYDDNPAKRFDYGTVFKWFLGGDPMDASLLQTTMMDIYNLGLFYSSVQYGAPLIDPYDNNIFYNCCFDVATFKSTFHKWEFVPGGNAVTDNGWGGWDNLTINETGNHSGPFNNKPNCVTDGNYIYANSTGVYNTYIEWNKLYCLNFNGDLIFNRGLSEWYMPDDPNPFGGGVNGQKNNINNGGFNHIYSRTPNQLFLLSFSSCMHEMIYTSRLLNDSNDDIDKIMFQNSNGDYFFDIAFSPEVVPNWFCLGYRTDYGSSPVSIAMDRNGFNIIGVAYHGLSSFGVSTQDGSGVGYMAFADDKIDEINSVKGGGIICDNGSGFDGLYFPGAIKKDIGSNDPDIASTWFVTFDSFGGTLSNVVSVEKQKPNEFILEQNVPNPFNPSTTISFSIPEKSYVTIEIFNISGQKINTLINGYLNSGQHSFKWDASDFSAGVYFYKVKAGKYEKTMRMTLVK